METIECTLNCLDTPEDSVMFSSSTTDVRFTIDDVCFAKRSMLTISAEDITFEDADTILVDGKGMTFITAHEGSDIQQVVLVNSYELGVALDDVGNQALNTILLNS